MEAETRIVSEHVSRTRRPLVRPVSQVLLSLTDSSAFEKAISETVTWMNAPSRCGGQIPLGAVGGQPFDLGDRIGAMPAAATMATIDGRTVWAAKLDFPDRDVGQRIWSTEVSVARHQRSTLFLARLTNVTLGEDRAFSPSVPGIVQRVLENLSVEADGFSLTEEPQVIDLSNVDSFVSLVTETSRRLPIIAQSVDERGGTQIDPRVLIRRLAGAAHIVSLTPEASWELTRALGRRYSVFNGASRLYWPNVDIEVDDPLRHPIRLSPSDGDSQGYVNWLARRILPTAFVRPPVDFEQIRFADVKALVATQARANVSGVSAKDESIEAVKSLKESLDTLSKQREQDSEAAQALLDEAADEIYRVERERDELASENQRLRAKIRAMALKQAGIAGHQDRRLTDFSDFEQWVDDVLGEGIEVLPRAIREVEKKGASELIDAFQDTLIMIRDYYIPMRRHGGMDLRNKFLERCRELNVEETACFSQSGAIKAFPEYRARYGSEWVWLDRHVKYGAGYDLRQMFRIYFYWDESNGIVVIGHMPSHLDNKNTQ